jgi:hypothetical protein
MAMNLAELSFTPLKIAEMLGHLEMIPLTIIPVTSRRDVIIIHPASYLIYYIIT